ncbi:hypothetical protein BaRGS_00015271 [Batillaria attramentaria]|uniref:CHHC U11-48K-type domain-containing protein n=1 Tax=Batillaria attramentaria TaxID=370345 RepID=A0ABD0L2K8_9CAEN
MTDSPQSRRDFIAEMQTFIEDECAHIGQTLAQLSWTPDHILKSELLVQCPHNSAHHLPEAALKKHSHACELRQRGCPKEDLALQLQDDDFYYEKADLVGKVKLDEGLLNSIIWNHCMENSQVYSGHRPLPVTHDDACVRLLREERLAVYDYCVQQLKAQGKMANIERDEVLTTDWEKIIKKGLLDGDGEKPKSKAELMAMLRDQKRRRQSYRAKNVHVTKKSYTEIIREVISNQVEILITSKETGDRVVEQPEEDQSEYSNGHGQRNGSRGDTTRSTHDKSPSRSRSPLQQRSRDREQRRSRTDIQSRYSDREYRDDDREYRDQRRYRERDRREYRDDDLRNVREASTSRREDEDSLVADYGDTSYDSDVSAGRESHHSSRHSKSAKKKKKKHKHKKHKSRHARCESDI